MPKLWRRPRASRKKPKHAKSAAVLEMYFNAPARRGKNAAEPLTKVDKITMYGDGNSAS